MPLAEGPTIDGGTAALILGVLLVILVSWCVATIRGFVWAARAGRGSRPDAVKWAVAMVVVLLPGLIVGPNILLVPCGLVAAAQAVTFVYARSGPST